MDRSSTFMHSGLSIIMIPRWMPVQRLMHLDDTENGLMVQFRWIPEVEATVEPLAKIYEDVPELLLKLLCRKNVPEDLVAKERRELHL